MTGMYIPRWFEPGADVAGALDHVGPATGLRGWILSKNDPERIFAVEVTSNGRALTKGATSVYRADLAEAVNKQVSCGFNIEWSRFDIKAISETITSGADSKFELFVPELNSYLRKYSDTISIEAITVKDLYDYIRKSGLIEYDKKEIAYSKLQTTSKMSNGETKYYAETRTIEQSGLFDPLFYSAAARELGESSLPPLEHYLVQGEQQGIRPNRYFDPKWYAFKYMSPPSASGALIHYIEGGERSGNKPSPVFEPRWYAETYGINTESQLALSHYLENALSNRFDPNRFFDVEFYLHEYPDLANSNIDGFWHWLNWGIFEGRIGAQNFNANFIWQKYLGNNRKLNPFTIFMDVGAEFGWEPAPQGNAATVYRQVATNSAAGPLFEPKGAKLEVIEHAPKIIALYLPQFHPIPENDLWWGAGFTEWRNIPRGLPRFEGHVQPRVPRDLGFYTLEGSATIRRQIELAKHAGLHGFCFYYYNFNGHRLLERPVETFLAEKDIDFPFCIMWANENWSRRWDGSESEVLIQQDYRQADLAELIDDIARHMRDPRYIRTSQSRPLFFVYRADVIPDCPKTIAAWRERFRTVHELDPLIVMSQSFGVEDPRPLGFDGAIEFPPHKLGAKLPSLNHSLTILDPDFDGTIRDYAAIVEESLAVLDPPFPLIKTAFPNWDNDARRQGHGLVFANSKPKAFQEWMTKLLNYAAENKFFGESLVFVNAWNEWCEGAYLEPDTHYGYAYLNAVGRALTSLRADLRRIVLVGHDAFPSGAQHLLLHMGATMQRRFGVEVRFVLIGGGEMVSRYREIAETFVAAEANDPWRALSAYLTDLKGAGFRYAVTNTTAAGRATTILAALDFSFCSLIHELPTLVSSAMLAPAYAEISTRAGTVVYPNSYVKAALDLAFGAANRPAVIRSQGLYHAPLVPQEAQAAVREELGLNDEAKIVLNLGYADLRKGVDLFIGLAEHVASLDPEVHFLWVGGVHPDIRPWLDLDLRQRGLRNVHFKGFTEDIGRYLGGADLFLLTSREDPFPSVVLEALAVGLPVTAFENSGGHVELLGEDPRLGTLLPLGVGVENAQRIVALLKNSALQGKASAAYRSNLVASRFNFAHYCSDLLRLVEPRYRSVSVIVPSYNYARYLPERLSSIFVQSYPVLEILVLDDASVDDSVSVARQAAEDAGRIITIERSETNSGNLFRQWKAGLDRARGEFVWIAEADDSSDPAFLAETISRLSGDADAAFCFTDSCAIGPDSSVIYQSYKGYYRQFGDVGLDRDGRFEGREFLRRFLTVRNHVLNASSMLWRTESLRNAFAGLGEDAYSFVCAGDWRIYLEACTQTKAVHYIATPLNRHRRHDRSVTHALNKQEHLAEIARIQEIALRECGNDVKLADRADAWQSELRQEWGLAVASAGATL